MLALAMTVALAACPPAPKVYDYAHLAGTAGLTLTVGVPVIVYMNDLRDPGAWEGHRGTFTSGMWISALVGAVVSFGVGVYGMHLRQPTICPEG